MSAQDVFKVEKDTETGKRVSQGGGEEGTGQGHTTQPVEQLPGPGPPHELLSHCALHAGHVSAAVSR